MGDNVKRLMLEFASADAIHSGHESAFINVLNVLQDSTKLRALFREAIQKVDLALEAIKSAPDNPYGMDDETICAVILEKIKEHDQAVRKDV